MLYAEGVAFSSLTLHPEIIGRRHRMRLLERMIQRMQNCAGVEFVRMREIAEAYRARRSTGDR